ncbi:hypothetical protein BDY21DRAFT_330369 [Lineolata rhizophorae]|uniref:UBC core domain-containing protein n=1 Tax=Lineolata rhizophorae TaxID=578093 RepID=A0A6A6PDK0_9PEZI|nr:hypothetical protein BDY21DRAFT_330369 [Lineolata rhizophorae]
MNPFHHPDDSLQPTGEMSPAGTTVSQLFSVMTPVQMTGNPTSNTQSEPNDSDRMSVDDSSTHGVSMSSVIQIIVQFSNGARVLVPISPTSNVNTLHEEVLRRATSMGIYHTTGDTVLQTTGSYPAVLCGQDTVAAVVNHASNENPTMLLRTHLEAFQPETVSGPSSPQAQIYSPGSSGMGPQLERPDPLPSRPLDHSVYIRWITIKDAMSESKLGDIGSDAIPVSRNTLVSELRQLASNRLYPDPIISQECLKSNLKVHMFLADCYLSPDNSMSLADLDLPGDQKAPLDIFVAVTSDCESSSNKLQEKLAFECTERGIATFMTSLQVLLREVEQGKLHINNFIEALWALTHFPPALIALKRINDHGVGVDGSSLPIFAFCFRELARVVVPPWISQLPSAVLEASRQVFAWLYSLQSDMVHANHTPTVMIGPVEIREAPENESDTTGGFSFTQYHQIANGPHGRKRVMVSMYDNNLARSVLLAQALHGAYTQPWDYFFSPTGTVDILEHERVEALHPSDFDNILAMANQLDAFRMVGPLQLADCLSHNLPVITLSETGFVSLYGHMDQGCGNRVFVTRNEIEGTKTLQDSNPGQYLLQKLDPIITQRKEENSWEVDAWVQLNQVTELADPDEAIVICVDVSGSMNDIMDPSWSASLRNGHREPSRLALVKDVFTNLVTRISAHKLATNVGLVTFSDRSNVNIIQPLTGVHRNFERKLDGITAGSFTAIWDALDKAKDMLVACKTSYKNAKCRVILLTDGENNDSAKFPSTVCADLYKNDIILDAIVIGTKCTMDLFKVANQTGGYAFNPSSRSLLYQIPMLETVIDIRTRPDIVKKPLEPWAELLPKGPDMSSLFDFPPCRDHPNQNDDFIALRDADRFIDSTSGRSPSSWSDVSSVTSESYGVRTLTGSTVGSLTTGRIIHNEVKAMIENQHEYIDVYVSESNIGFWKVVMQGPPGSPYEKGTFLLSFGFGDHFPQRPPTVRFVTPILHPNVTKHGRICHPIFDREWTSSTRAYQVLQHTWGILMTFEIRDAVDPLFTVQTWTKPASARVEIGQYIDRFASKSRQQMRTDILGSTTSSVASSPSSTSSNSGLMQSIHGTPSSSTSALAAHFASRRTPQSNTSDTASAASLLREVSTRSGSNRTGGSRRRTFFQRFR